MIIPGNYHTHTTFCDGEAEPAEYVRVAVEQGLSFLGFSAHAMFPFAGDCHLPVQRYDAYFSEITRLKEAWKDKITILAGVEAEWIRPISIPDFSLYSRFPVDYIIGSVHTITPGGQPASPWYSVDGSTDDVRDCLVNGYGGDGKKLVQQYFAEEREMVRHGDFTFVGHPDLVRRRNDALHFFDENDPWYIRELEATAQAIGESGKPVEINLGGMARGGIAEPYPSATFLKLLRKRDVPVLINSDAHNPHNLTYMFDKGLEHARAAGYTEILYLTDKGFKTQKI